MPPAARITDTTGHGTPLAPGPGSENVLIGGLPAWRATIDQHACPMVNVSGADGVGAVVMGSPTVLINYMMACRMGDMVIEKPGLAMGPINPIVMGCPTVMIGEMASGGSTSAMGVAMTSAKKSGASYAGAGEVLGDEEPSPAKQLDWIGIRLINESGDDISGEELHGQITDGNQPQTRISDGQRYSQIPSGTCHFSFPKFYEDMQNWDPWENVEPSEE